MSANTAGKEPGITFHAQSGTGIVRVSPKPSRSIAVLGVLDEEGQAHEVRLSPAELRILAKALVKVAGALEADGFCEEITQS